ncbi:MAG: PHP domain-containing protein [Lachnospiraceae bacterium]|nr:PHP domain-containing protein [Lachnospiraceae bacterium]
MKFDMHCHTKEGSLDGKLPLAEYVAILKKKGFQGMLITDHNSYNAYRYYKKHKQDSVFSDFTVLKGIEYDTIDAGHILVIMPEHIRLPLIELRGLPVSVLIDAVHFFGGILGPAHPCGEKYLSITNTRRYRKNPGILASFDFLETFNACEPAESNRQAAALAAKYNLPGFGGSDAHRADCAGLSFTSFDGNIKTESDLIRHIRARQPVSCGGEYYHGTTKEKIGKANDLLLYSFWLYNKTSALFRSHQRRAALNHYLELGVK